MVREEALMGVGMPCRSVPRECQTIDRSRVAPLVEKRPNLPASIAATISPAGATQSPTASSRSSGSCRTFPRTFPRTLSRIKIVAMQNVTPAAIAVLVLELAPATVFALAGERIGQACARWPSTVRTALPLLCAIPYVLLSTSQQMFSWKWCVLYAALPVAIAWVLGRAAIADPEQRGNWRDAMVLLTLGLAVDLRWFERAWPTGLTGLGKLLLVDAAMYGFLAIRRLRGTGFDFHLRWSDWRTGLRELAFFMPFVLGLGMALGFLHPHGYALRLSMAPTWIYIFIFIAVPEELYFR